MPSSLLSSVAPSPLALNLSQHQGFLQWVSSSHQVAKELELQLQHQSFQWMFRVDFLLDWLLWSPCSPNLPSRVFSSTTVQKHQFVWHSAFFMVQLSHPHMTTGKTTALTIWIFVDKVMSLLFNMLSKLVILFLPWRKHVSVLWLQSLSTVILEPKKVKSVTRLTVILALWNKVGVFLFLFFWNNVYNVDIIYCWTIYQNAPISMTRPGILWTDFLNDLLNICVNYCILCILRFIYFSFLILLKHS